MYFFLFQRKSRLSQESLFPYNPLRSLKFACAESVTVGFSARWERFSLYHLWSREIWEKSNFRSTAYKEKVTSWRAQKPMETLAWKTYPKIVQPATFQLVSLFFFKLINSCFPLRMPCFNNAFSHDFSSISTASQEYPASRVSDLSG